MKLPLVLALFTSILKDQSKYVEDVIFSSMAATAALHKMIHNLQ
jgi:hypothetical protein